MGTLVQSFKHSFRALLRAPAFSAAVVVTLALGIGANTVIFSVVNTLLLNPHGVSDPERVVAVRVNYGPLNLPGLSMSVPDFADVRDSKQQFGRAAVLRQVDFNFAGEGGPERLQGASVNSTPRGVAE